MDNKIINDNDNALNIMLEMRKMNEQFFNYLQSIIERNNQMKIEYINEKNLYIIEEYNNNIILIKQFIENLLTDINKNIKEKCIYELECIHELECLHELEEDDIDIDPDTSKRIKYCIKCNKTF
jgi:hypothetical protein